MTGMTGRAPGLSIATGLDIAEVARIERVLERSPGFAQRYFTADERERCTSSRQRAREFATLFAVKEALLKALGTGVLGPIGLTQIEVHRAGKQTTVALSGAAAQAVGSRRVWVSTACDGRQAWAVVVVS